MLKDYLLMCLLTIANLFAKAQIFDTSTNKLRQTEIRAVYSQYVQDGRHSAVTGGEGTEELSVYAPSLRYTHISERGSISFEAGIDLISSASTDNIDFRMSSASRKDGRTHLNIDYTRQPIGKSLSWSVGTGVSMESDYLSLPIRAAVEKTSKDKMRTYSFSAQAFIDDLRWGRLDEDYHRPVTVIYPVELRYREWLDKHMRYSYSLQLGVAQVVDKRNVLGVFTDISYQAGLLSTPFHRVYFVDDSKAVEVLPDHRLKAALSFRLNSFIRGNLILKNQLDAYTDDFGIQSLALRSEVAWKVRPLWTLKPHVRVYAQTASPYFTKFGQHQLEAKYATSDFDLSELQTYEFGLASRLFLKERVAKKLHIQEIEIGYAYFFRSDGLNAHVLQAAFLLQALKKKQK